MERQHSVRQVRMVPVSRAAAAMIDFGPSMFTIKELGDVTIVLREGEAEAIVARGQKFVGNDVSVTVNGIMYTAYVALGSNLTLIPETMPSPSNITGPSISNSAVDQR